ncbi:MAG: Uma2 family endonuclease [Planctomycetota bacterium]|nr:Uma2 family endonuclease [Planctomycetota bacterium]
MSSILDQPAIRHAALPITVEQYHHLSEHSIISERTELLRGVIIEQMTKSPLHTYVVQFLVKWLESVIGANYHVRKEEPLTLAESEPEPDIAVVWGTPKDYRAAHPYTAELVVEVAVTTLDLDRDKAEIYAAAGVPEYWIVVPEERAVEVFRDPSASGYGTRVRHLEPDTTLRSNSLPQVALRMASLFG